MLTLIVFALGSAVLRSYALALSGDEVLRFDDDARHQVNVVCKTEIAYRCLSPMEVEM